MQISLITTLAALVSLAQCTVTKPAAGDQWIVGEKSTIAWDTAGFSDKIDIALVPAGATDTSVIIAQIATATANTGSYTWAPPSTMSGGEVSVIIVNSQQSSASSSISVSQTSSTSGVFVIVISSGSKGSNSNGSHGSKNNTTETATAALTTTISSTATLTNHITVPANITTPQTSQPTAVEETTTILSPAAPYANSTATTTAEAAGVTAPSQTLLTSVSGTGAGGAQQTFTGAAPALEMNRAQMMISGGVAVLTAILFL
ncbi:hypothetical protein ACEPPN_003050 [Leptodophora sp. 'Broadleaf-Isolate-01']